MLCHSQRLSRHPELVSGTRRESSAFTLAEVLITLGIIGVVAAMTMPVLMANYQKNAINSQFKRVYANMFNALRMVQAQRGDTPQCYYTDGNPNGGLDRTQVSECVTFYDELTKNMQVVKTCNGNAYNDGCIPKYNGVDTIKEYEDSSTISGCGGYQQSNILNRNFAYVFNDGSVLFTYEDLPGWGSVFAIDVNGKKGPNKWGYDVFSFAWREQNHNIILEAGTCSLVEKGGIEPSSILLNAVK